MNDAGKFLSVCNNKSEQQKDVPTMLHVSRCVISKKRREGGDISFQAIVKLQSAQVFSTKLNFIEWREEGATVTSFKVH